MHDRIAELAGLRNELATCENGPRLSRRDSASAVRKEIARLVKELAEHVDALEDRAKQLMSAGDDHASRAATAEAQRIRAALGDDAPKSKPTGRGKPGTAAKHDAAAAKAPEHT